LHLHEHALSVALLDAPCVRWQVSRDRKICYRLARKVRRRRRATPRNCSSRRRCLPGIAHALKGGGAHCAGKEHVVKKVAKKRLRLDREVVATLVSELTAAGLRQVAGGRAHESDGADCSQDKQACTIPT
jgi:hypothetical protein